MYMYMYMYMYICIYIYMLLLLPVESNPDEDNWEEHRNPIQSFSCCDFMPLL